MNENLANQLVVVTKADYEAMVHEQAHKEAVALSEPKSSDITSKGEVIKSIMCNGERFLSRKDAAKILDVGLNYKHAAYNEPVEIDSYLHWLIYIV